MKKLLLFLTLVMIALQAGATPVDESAARQIAQEFFMNALFPDSPPASGCDLRLVHAERSGANVAQNAYYIYNTGRVSQIRRLCPYRPLHHCKQPKLKPQLHKLKRQ